MTEASIVCIELELDSSIAKSSPSSHVHASCSVMLNVYIQDSETVSRTSSGPRCICAWCA